MRSRIADDRRATSGGDKSPPVVLVLDPAGLERSSTVAALASAGYNAIGGDSREVGGGEGAAGEAGTGVDTLEAPDCMAALHADLVVLDPVTPRGIAFASSLTFLGVPVVVVSRERELLGEARKAGLPAISKPLDVAALLALVRAVLDARQTL